MKKPSVVRGNQDNRSAWAKPERNAPIMDASLGFIELPDVLQIRGLERSGLIEELAKLTAKISGKLALNIFSEACGAKPGCLFHDQLFSLSAGERFDANRFHRRIASTFMMLEFLRALARCLRPLRSASSPCPQDELRGQCRDVTSLCDDKHDSEWQWPRSRHLVLQTSVAVVSRSTALA
jgi:hypothetical protein